MGKFGSKKNAKRPDLKKLILASIYIVQREKQILFKISDIKIFIFLRPY